ncbi:MAG: prenyltransferase/squalene oxidase repeat-containing protein [Gemmataceae bacterium]
MIIRLRSAAIAFAFAAAFATLPATTAQPTAADQWKATVAKATAYVKKVQAEDGSWGPAPQNRGITGVIVTGLLKTGSSPDDQPTAKALSYIESLINEKEGHIAGKENPVVINYATSINVMALSAANRSDKYKAVIGNAAKYLRSYQWDEDTGNKKPDNDYYGGAGYAGEKSRPDLSNTAFFLEALKASGAPKDDPAFKKALVFVSRCQNFKSEFNTAEWAAKNNDGSFIYTGANGGENRRTDGDGRKTDMGGYGTMTYAGIKSMIYCNVGKDDPRMKAAIEWIKKNYTLDANPGMPESASGKGLYYYYHTFAKTMDALGIDEFEDAKGVKHDWRTELTAALAKRQKEDGSWKNDNPGWLEGDPTLDVGYALMALGYAKPKK